MPASVDSLTVTVQEILYAQLAAQAPPEAGHLPLLVGWVVGLAAFAALYRPFFGVEKDFWECVWYSLKPDFMSWLDKDLQRDFGKSLKLSCFLFLVIGGGWLAKFITEGALR